jgi:ribonuclease P protein subunit RPR2
MKRRRARSLSPEKVKIAKERMDILFNLAEKELKKNPERSRRYVELARKIGMRCNVRLTREQKRKFCKKCNQLLISKKSCEIKVDPQKKFMEIKCLNCGSVYRKPYAKKI